MLIGAMNHPRSDVLEELDWMARLELDFVDLTLEPPASASWLVDPKAIKQKLQQTGLDVIGHTAYYLPIASPIEELRRAAVTELTRCMEVFSQVGARWMNIHPDHYAPMHDRSYAIERNLKSLEELLEPSRRLGVGLMIENTPGHFNTVKQLAELLEPLPQLGLHLDIGHCNLHVADNTAESLIHTFSQRLEHVHLHDNHGGTADLHLPLGTGNIDYCACVSALKQSGYDGMITLEIFSSDRHYFLYSRDVLREVWDSA